jgi:hypothetical protein
VRGVRAVNEERREGRGMGRGGQGADEEWWVACMMASAAGGWLGEHLVE